MGFFDCTYAMTLGTGGLWNRLPITDESSPGPMGTPVTSLVRAAERVNYPAFGGPNLQIKGLRTRRDLTRRG